MGDMDSKSRTSWKEVEGEEGGSERGGEGGRKGGREGGKEGGLNVPNHAPGPGAVHLLQVKLCVFHGHTGSSHGEVGEAGLREGGREGRKEGKMVGVMWTGLATATVINTERKSGGSRGRVEPIRGGREGRRERTCRFTSLAFM